MKTKLINDFVLNEGSIFFIVVNKDGKIIETNGFSNEVVGENIIGKHISEVFVDFTINWGFANIIKQNNKLTLINVNTFSGLPRSFNFKIEKINDEILFLGKLNIVEIEKTRTKYISINNEIINLSRSLQKSNYNLKKLDELKNQFLGMATHDLRSPIHLIQNYSEFLMEDLSSLEDEQKYFLESIHSSAQFMSKIIHNFLDFSLIESGHMTLQTDLVDINTLINPVLQLAKDLAKRRNITLKTGNINIISKVNLDISKVQQVLNNLISNAIDHSPEKSTIYISAEENKESIVFLIKDEGEGISKEFIENMFNPYSKERNFKLNASKRSIGLGLAIAKKIVDAHQGKIWAESIKGVGSEFFVSLPKKKEIK